MQKVQASTPIACSRCDWLGISEQASGSAICPACRTRTSPQRQKGLDKPARSLPRAWQDWVAERHG